MLLYNRDPENQSDEAAEEEEVIRTDMVQNMLEKVLNLLCNLVRSKKELAERVGYKSGYRSEDPPPFEKNLGLGGQILGGRTDLVQNMLEKVLNLLFNLVRSKKELAERVVLN